MEGGSHKYRVVGFDFKIGKDLLYMIVDELEGDADLRKNFGLKKRD